jgi:Flp pilus assembly secretin CpaC
MTASSASRRQPIQLTLLVAALCAALAATPARAAEIIRVMLDQATITKMPERVATLVIGNPLIADVSVQPGGLLVVTGKGYGSTNMIALDRSGAVLAERTIEVLGAQDRMVVVYRGVNRESYSCAPMCEPRMTLGDSPEYFNLTMQSAETRAAREQSQGSAPAAAPAR